MEDKPFYYDVEKKKLYWIEWEETGNNDIPHIHYIDEENKKNATFKSKEQELLYRVFKQIAKDHFADHKMGPNYCNKVLFDRGVGDDVSDYIQATFPEQYHLIEKKLNGETK